MPTLHRDPDGSGDGWKSSSENNPCSARGQVQSTTTPFTTHDWPVISHYYVHLCAKVLAGVIVGVRSPIRHHAELSGLCRYTRLDTFEDFVVVVPGLARVYEIDIRVQG